MKDRALLLAVDNCGPDDWIALGQQLFGEFHNLGEASLGGRHNAAKLIGEAMNLLRMADVQPAWLNAIVAVNGPGSLNRIRIGLDTVKTLAKDNRTPIVAVSRLEVLAAASGISCVALDARQHEIFLRLAEPSGAAREMRADMAVLASVPPPSRVAFCEKIVGQLLASAWPAAELVKVPAPTAADACRLAAARIKAAEFIAPDLLELHPLCRSDREAKIRPMVAADLDHVLSLAESLPETPRWPKSAYLHAIAPESTPRRVALVATDPWSTSVLGFAVASLLPPQAELEVIAVARECQRQGIGQGLSIALANELKAAGVHELILELRPSNGSAQAFYQSLGFVWMGLRPDYYTDPVEDAVLMNLLLG